ncbi:hypothetical protein P376_2809 [Streptomyces sp. HCCB10043]|nr:hypothetical protein P376_2809 [Streptomyces sp. HCCB10043]
MGAAVGERPYRPHPVCLPTADCLGLLRHSASLSGRTIGAAWIPER